VDRWATKSQAFRPGTLAGAGSFRCDVCGFAVALHELDEIPACPHCGNGRFKRSSIFGDHADAEPWGGGRTERPDWLDEVRDALATDGDYLAYRADDRVHVVPLQEGWTRIGRSMAAHVHFDDPTISRRHALVHCEEGGSRVLDDRSLNGVFVNGERIEWHSLEDGDEILVGRFRLYFMTVGGTQKRAHGTQAGARAERAVR
jgi:predicted  nucleic acid-binding Zn-ribbon protein